jgi:hypothetical protein
MPITSIRKEIIYLMLCFMILYFIVALIYDYLMIISVVTYYLWLVFIIQERQTLRNIYNMSSGRFFEPYFTISRKIIETCKKFTVRKILRRILFFPLFPMYMYYLDKGSFYIFFVYLINLIICSNFIELYMNYKKIEFDTDYDKKFRKLIGGESFFAL